MPDGAALVVNCRSYDRPPAPVKAPNRLSVLYRSAFLLSQNSDTADGPVSRPFSRSRRMGRAILGTQLAVRALRKLSGLGDEALIDINAYAFNSSARRWGMSRFSHRRLAGCDPEAIKTRRRDNYRCLLSRLPRSDSLYPLLPDLPEGVCPLFFPLSVKDREQLSEYLAARRIDSHPWWGFFHDAVDWNRFPDAKWLKSHVLGLPIHQNLTTTHMDAIANAVGSYIDVTHGQYPNRKKAAIE
jgi:hypothetical protein